MPIDLKLRAACFRVIHHFVYQPIFADAILFGQFLWSRIHVSVVFRQRFVAVGFDAFAIDALVDVVALNNERVRYWAQEE